MINCKRKGMRAVLQAKYDSSGRPKVVLHVTDGLGHVNVVAASKWNVDPCSSNVALPEDSHNSAVAEFEAQAACRFFIQLPQLFSDGRKFGRNQGARLARDRELAHATLVAYRLLATRIQQ